MEINSRRATAIGRRHSASRERVLREVELQDSATVAELAARTGLHENTVRGHLAALEHDGHVRQLTAPPSGGRGRPTRHWSAVNAAEQPPYVGLAVALADALDRSSPHAAHAAHEAGVAWGAQLARTDSRAGTDPRAGTYSRPSTGPRAGVDPRAGSDSRTSASFTTSDGSTGRERVMRVMREQGFAPEERAAIRTERNSDPRTGTPHAGTPHTGTPRTAPLSSGPAPEPAVSAPASAASAASLSPIILRACPLLAAAADRSDIVCAVHEGMIEGLIGPGKHMTAQLRPFATPDGCALHLFEAAQ